MSFKVVERAIASFPPSLDHAKLTISPVGASSPKFVILRGSPPSLGIAQMFFPPLSTYATPLPSGVQCQSCTPLADPGGGLRSRRLAHAGRSQITIVLSP